MPNLFVAGGPKCGTTSMHNYLGQHPDIFMSPVKEPKFFVSDGRRPEYRGPGDMIAHADAVWTEPEYRALFAPAGNVAFIGESSPYYLWSAEAQQRIQRAVPDPWFIVMLRDPVERAISNWTDLWSAGREKLPDVAQGIAAEEERRQRGWEPFWLYRDLGLFGQQLEQMLRVFRAERVKVVIHDEFVNDTKGTLSDIFAWLGIAEDVDIEIARHGQTWFVPQTPLNRLLEATLRRPLPFARRLPPSIRERGQAAITGRLRQSAAGRKPPRPSAEIRDHFRADLQRLQEIVPNLPAAWLGD